MRFLRLFHQYIWRDIGKNRLRAALTWFGIALGVGVVIAVQLANDRAIGSFTDSMQILNGQSDLQISANGLPIDENIIRQLAWIWDLGSMAPIVEGRGRIVEPRPGATEPPAPVYITGVDFLSDAPFRKYIGKDENDLSANITRDEFVTILQDPEAIVIPEALAREFNVDKGSRLQVLIGDTLRKFTVGAVLRDEGVGRAFAGRVIFMDIAAAQLALRKLGKIDRIDVQLNNKSQIEAVESRIRKQLPANAIVFRTESSTAQTGKLLRAFRYNLTALSYISLVVGVILVYNTLMIAVVRRRSEIGTLRALGTPRRTIGALFLLEAAAFGLAGSVAGIGLGVLMSSASSALVSQTVQSIYTGFFRVTRGETIDVRFILEAVSGGTLLAVLSGTAPALRATMISPALVLRQGSVSLPHISRSVRVATVIGVLMVGAGVFLSFAPPVDGFPFLGYAAEICFIAGAGLATPWMARILVRMITRLVCAVSPITGRLAIQSMRSGMNRIAVAVFSLAIAVAMLVSVATMVSSFRDTVIVWVDQTFKADLYIRPAAAGANEWESTFDPAVVDHLAGMTSIAGIDRFRGHDVDLDGTRVVLATGEFDVLRDHGQLLFRDGRTMQQVAARMIGQDRIIVSEPFAIKQGRGRGDFIELPTAEGRKQFQIEAVFYDYSNDRGLLVMDRSTYLRRFKDPSVSNIAVYLKTQADIQQVQASIAEQLSNSHLRVTTNAEMKRQVLRVFDQTFRITYALETIAIAVAVLGIANILAALILERRAEFAVLRFLGTNRRQLRRIVLTESAVTGMIGIVVGTALGLALSLILVYVINRQSFGWTIQFGIPGSFLARSLITVFLATVAAGIYPTILVRRLDPLRSIRAE